MNRISPVLDRLIGIEDPSELVTELEEVISDSVSAPEAGQFFVFSYVPKKADTIFDVNPLVAVTEVYSWGFRGVNFHHGQYALIHFQIYWSDISCLS